MDNTSSIQGPQMFQMPNMGTGANQAFSQIGGLNQFGSLGSGILPQAQQTSQNLYNNPFAQQGLQGAQMGAQMGQQGANTGFGVGQNLVGAGGNLMNQGGALMGEGGQVMGAGNQMLGAGNSWMGAGQSLVPYANQVMNTGFDPQQQLYQRTLQQVQDQSNVNNSMAGVGTSPYGAGLTNQATENFNIDWQNQQLQRQALAGQTGAGMLSSGAGIASTGAGINQTGANVAGTGANIFGQGAGIQGQGAGLQGQGVNMMNQAPGQMVQSSMLPYATYSDIGQGQNSALSSLLGLGGQGQGLANMPIQDLLAYLGVGNQAGGVANQNFNNQLGQAQQSWNQNSQFASGLGSLAGQFLPMMLGL